MHIFQYLIWPTADSFMLLGPSNIKHGLPVICLLLAIYRSDILQCSSPWTNQIRQSENSVLTALAHSPRPNRTGMFVQDFYKFYSRDIETSVWGDELPKHSKIPRSGLGIFMILWTQDDEQGRKQLKRCLQSLDVFFNDRFDYPVLILHEDLQQEAIETVQTWTRSRIEFVGHSLIDPDYLKAFQRTRFKMFDCYPEYLHMIRTNIFWLIDMFSKSMLMQPWWKTSISISLKT